MSSLATRVCEILRKSPSGLFSDFDGVLSEIAPTPAAAFAHPGVADTFHRIAEDVDVAGIITGRAVDDVNRMFPIDTLTVVGNHGLEWWEQGSRHDHPAGVEAVQAIATVMAETEKQLSAQMDTTGMIWENKRLSSTVHFRNVDDPAAVESALLPIVQPLADAHNLRCTFGKMIIEFRPQAHVTKGTALAQLVEQHGLRAVIFAGDDVTDVDGFRTLHELRAQGVKTLAIGVVTPDAHPDVAAYADVTVGSVAEFATMLAEVADCLERPR
ncbi:MAG: trehalose-phosphatase [Thermomicrobiales bacterium]|nr:trehalose-phosphatase [Thermomicrobiales bacterium]